MIKLYEPKDFTSEVPYDMAFPPMRQKWYLRPITWLVSFPTLWIKRSKIHKVRMAGIKPPYLLLCNHNAFYDFLVTTCAIFPHRANYVISIDVYPGLNWVLRRVGGICKRKFITDTNLVRQLTKVIQNGDVAVLYPEARYSFCGTPCVLPSSVGKLAKLLKVPVVTLVMNGHHINQPFWNLRSRGVRTEATITQIFTAEEVKSATAAEISQKIRDTFDYDDYRWQKENRIAVNKKWRAEGLDHILYQCPSCLAEGGMQSKDHRLFCTKCGKTWNMSKYGELHAEDGNPIFTHIPDWFEWQRLQVRKEVLAGNYHMQGKVLVDNIRNEKGYIRMGEGILTHNYHGFDLVGTGPYGDFHVHRDVADNLSCHIEYNFKNQNMDCVSFSTTGDTYFVYCTDPALCPTKIYFATEEMHYTLRQMDPPISPSVCHNMSTYHHLDSQDEFTKEVCVSTGQ